jgi:hypothetical protein
MLQAGLADSSFISVIGVFPQMNGRELTAEEADAGDIMQSVQPENWPRMGGLVDKRARA